MDEPPPSRAGTLPLVGGALALDFCNSTSGRGTDRRLEHLLAPGDLIAWARHAGILAEADAAGLCRIVDGDPALGARILAAAFRLRDAIYAVDAALAQGNAAPQAALDALAEAHAGCLARGRLTARGDSFGWVWHPEEAPEAAILGPIAASAIMVISAADHARLKRCEGHHCGWLFLDVTKSNNRRWCEMEVCGNRAKQSRRRGRDRALG